MPETMEEIKNEIAEIEIWLRDHPNAEWQSRYDMIQKLAQLNEQLNTCPPKL
jgi:hypothetical protein